ncbi:RNA 3'-terminal phosphate cyclase [Halobacteriales archaeon QS_1_68_20]|nr:MAG: RNA 3'-terminal phosphate cyclase [Halobacteriales archaeon QS_1_68_20]
MLELDGADGGGQLVRTALALSALTGTSFEMTGIRGARSEPGLRPQHLTAVETLAAITDADVEGAEQGSESLTFEPATLRGGEYEATIGTAGSTTLLFDAVLPLAAELEEPIWVRATGGTDVKWSPPADFHRRVKLPLLRRHGLLATVDLHRRGFYPAGGGEATLHLAPSSPTSPKLTDRGPLSGARVYSVASEGLADSDVAERQADEASQLLSAADVEVVERTATYVAADSAGTALVVALECERSVAGFDALGEPGKPAEDVAADAVEAALSFRDAAGAVDAHLADQVLVPLALAGGEVAVPRVTDHVESSLDLLDAFGYDVAVEARDEGAVLRA